METEYTKELVGQDEFGCDVYRVTAYGMSELLRDSGPGGIDKQVGRFVRMAHNKSLELPRTSVELNTLEQRVLEDCRSQIAFFIARVNSYNSEEQAVSDMKSGFPNSLVDVVVLIRHCTSYLFNTGLIQDESFITLKNFIQNENIQALKL